MPDLGEPAFISDLQFIRDKVKDGDWWEVTGAIDTLAAEIAFVPASGKTAFLYSAKIVISDNPTAVGRGNPAGADQIKDQVVAD